MDSVKAYRQPLNQPQDFFCAGFWMVGWPGLAPCPWIWSAGAGTSVFLSLLELLPIIMVQLCKDK
jgi:hypothetical protein